MLIGAGIFKVTSDAWELTGSSVILGYLVLAPAILATSVAYSVFLSTPLGREPGGEYTHLSRTFGGYGLAFVGVWLKIISYIGALAYLARALARLRHRALRRRAAEDRRRCRSPSAASFSSTSIHVAGVRWFGRIQVWMCVFLGVSIVVARRCPDCSPSTSPTTSRSSRTASAGSRPRCRWSSSRTPASSRWRRRQGRCATPRAACRAFFCAASWRRRSSTS